MNQQIFHQEQNEKRGLGIAALVLGILAVLAAFVPILGIVLAVIALILAVKQEKTLQTGQAKAGKIIAIIGGSLNAVWTFLVIVLGVTIAASAPKFTDVSEAAEQASCRANMRTIASQQVIYVAQSGSYTDRIEDLGLQGIRCPACERPYILQVNNSGHSMKVLCPDNPSHGSIDDGIASWSH